MQLVGPVLFYELVRNARRGRLFLLRVGYVLLLLTALGLAFLAMEPRLSYLADLRGGLSPQMMTELAESFFGLFLAVQFLAVVLLTPCLVASAITEEKQRKTLDFLFTTDLRNREIILGKFGSRLAGGLMLLAAGYPVLSMVQLFGGVDPFLLLAGYGIGVVTLVSLSCVTLYFSVLASRVREALLKTYLAMVAYLGIWGVIALFHGLALLDHPRGSALDQFFGQLHRWWNIGNPLFLVYSAAKYVQARSPSAFADLLRQGGLYAGFHLTLAALLLWRSVRVVRRVYLRQTYDPKPKKRLTGWMALPVGAALRRLWAPGQTIAVENRKARRKPPLGSDPMRWKERYVERGMRFGPLVQTFYILLLLALLAPAFVAAGVALANSFSGSDVEATASGLNEYFRLLCVVLLALTTMSVGLRAAACVASERDRQTWDALLASPLTIGEILCAKGWGSLWGARRMLLLFALLTAMCMAARAADLVGGLAALLSFSATAYFFAGLGLWCAARSQTVLRALFFFMAMLVLAVLWPTALQVALVITNELTEGWLFSFLFGGGSHGWSGGPDWFRGLAYMSPLQSLWYAPARWGDLALMHTSPWEDFVGEPEPILVLMFLLALLYFFFGGQTLWRRARRQLERSCGRVDFHVAARAGATLLPAAVPPGSPG